MLYHPRIQCHCPLYFFDRLSFFSTFPYPPSEEEFQVIELDPEKILRQDLLNDYNELIACLLEESNNEQNNEEMGIMVRKMRKNVEEVMLECIGKEEHGLTKEVKRDREESLRQESDNKENIPLK